MKYQEFVREVLYCETDITPGQIIAYDKCNLLQVHSDKYFLKDTGAYLLNELFSFLNLAMLGWIVCCLIH